MSRFHETSFYTFKPHKLMIAAKELADKYDESSGSVTQARHIKRINRIMKKIRALDSSDEVIERFAEKMRGTEVRSLLSVFPDDEESEATLTKCSRIIALAEGDYVPQRLWKTYQNRHQNEWIVHTIKNRKGFTDGLRIQDNASKKVLQKVLQADEMHNGILAVMNQRSGKISNRLSAFAIEDNTLLGSYLQNEIVILNIWKDQFIVTETKMGVIQLFNKLKLNNKKRAMISYIENRDFQAFDRNLMDAAFKDFGSVNNRNHRWDFLNEEQFAKLKSWLMLANIEAVFADDKNNARFEFWKTYIQHMKEAYLLDKQPIILMKFDGFAVVEFGKIGAAYFYHEEGFEKVIMQVPKSERYRTINSPEGINSMFKRNREYKDRKTGAKLFIDKYPHNVGWQRRFRLYMSNYLNGKF